MPDVLLGAIIMFSGLVIGATLTLITFGICNKNKK